MEFLDLIDTSKQTLSAVHAAHGEVFHGFAQFQLEKKLTSSSVAAACWLFAWTVRHLSWRTREDYIADSSAGLRLLRGMIRAISRSLAEFNPASRSAGHVDVEFLSEGFKFEARSVAQSGNVPQIYDFHRQIRERQDDETFILTDAEVRTLCELTQRVLATQAGGSGEYSTAENLKLEWLRAMMDRHATAKFLVFTDNLQTCSVLQSAFGTAARQLVGSMDASARRRAVADLRLGRGNARILVATSAADEGFDLQVADRVVHWDLSASPAVLMQRNGRVARLGQRADVRAYYLILEGTHEERRDTRLQQTFGELGIEDESLRNRILGSLEEDELERLEEGVRNADGRVIGTILRSAADDNRRMEQELEQLSESLEATAVLDRNDLCKRLTTWQTLGLPDTQIDYEIRDESWERPVFGERTTTETAVAKRATLRRGRRRKEVVFDPEYMVFGEGTTEVSLAGLRPWTSRETDRGRWLTRPDAQVDYLGDLFCHLARLPQADFGRADAGGVQEAVPGLADAEYLLFCSHPILEDETEVHSEDRPYLNCYGFLVDGTDVTCKNLEGISAGDVQTLIKELEDQAVRSAGLSVTTQDQAEEYRRVSGLLRGWLQETTKFGAETFLDQPRYFVPVPVALIAVEEKLLDGV